MSRRTIASDVLFPKPWPQVARAAVLHAVSLASMAVTILRARAITSRVTRVRRSTEVERLRNEVLLLREELRIKDTRMASLPAPRRPRYEPVQRMAILELRPSAVGRWTRLASGSWSSLGPSAHG